LNTRMPPEYLLPGPAMAQEPEGSGMSLQQVYLVLLAHWRTSLLIFACLVAISVVVIKKMPRTYTATATLILDYRTNDRMAPQEFPTGMIGSYLATQIEVLRSSDILDPVINRLELTKDPEFMAGYAPKNGSLLSWAREALRAKLEIGSGQYGSQLIHITAMSRNPERAAQLADAVAGEFETQQVRRLTEPASERAKRYGGEVQLLADQVNVIQAKIAAVRRNSGLTDLTASQTDSDTAALANLETRYLEAQNARRNAEVRLSAESAAGSENGSTPAIQALRTQLNTYASQMAQLRTIYGSQHVKVLELQNQIDATQRALDATVSSHVANASTDLAAARELEAKLRTAVDQQRAKLMQARTVQDESQKLLLELDSAQTAYKTALGELNRVQVTASGQYTNISVMSHAEVPVRPASPKSMKLFLLAVIAALGAGVAIPFAWDMLLDRRIRCADDVANDLRLPLLAEFAGSNP
jgi:polysaccharide biosynthesis transport protein